MHVNFISLLLDVAVIGVVSIYSASGLRFMSGVDSPGLAAASSSASETGLVLGLYYATLLAIIIGFYSHKPDEHVLSAESSTAFAVVVTAFWALFEKAVCLF